MVYAEYCYYTAKKNQDEIHPDLVKYQLVGIYPLNILAPRTKTITQMAITIKNKTLAIAAAPEAISVKPKTPAIIATMKKINDHFSIKFIV